ncbi:hypothetical protein K0U07_01870 [bacterium]|nr:hypothetical protein [bacterium]
MRKYVLALGLICATSAHAEEVLPAVEKAQEAFVVDLTAEQQKHCKRFIMELGGCYASTAAARSGYYKALGKRTRGVPTTQFLGYAFADQKRLRHLRWIASSSIKWPGVRKSLIRGLKKEAESGSLFEVLPSFAKHCGAEEDTLRYLAEEGNWKAFLKHLLKKR